MPKVSQGGIVKSSQRRNRATLKTPPLSCVKKDSPDEKDSPGKIVEQLENINLSNTVLPNFNNYNVSSRSEALRRRLAVFSLRKL